jgi:hypothetical protein
MSTNDLLAEVCGRRLRALTTLTRDEMRLAGYPDSIPEIDVCTGMETGSTGIGSGRDIYSPKRTSFT